MRVTEIRIPKDRMKHEERRCSSIVDNPTQRRAT